MECRSASQRMEGCGVRMCENPVFERSGLGDLRRSTVPTATFTSCRRKHLLQHREVRDANFGLAPDLEPEPVDDLVDINVLQQQYDHQRGDVTVGVLITNRSAHTIRGPLQLTVNRVSSPFISLAQPSGRTSRGLDYLDLTGYLDDLRFNPGQSIFINATFNNAARCPFEFELGVRGLQDSDDNNWLSFTR